MPSDKTLAALTNSPLQSSAGPCRPAECHLFYQAKSFLYTCQLFSAIGVTFLQTLKKGLQRIANEYAEERRIYKDLISKNNNVDILNSASRILQC